jgi:hypothetical protein
MIEPEDLAKLAEFYDQYANALDRQSPERAAARRQFLARLESLYQQEASGITFDTFRFETVKRCKEYLRKN